MSSSKTIDERRQQRDELQAAVDKMKVDRKALKKSIATLEHHVLKLEIGEKGSLYRLAKLIDSTEDMEILKVVSFFNRKIQSLMFSSNK